MAIWAAIIGSVVSAGLSAASQPDVPDGASSSRKVSRAEIETLPGRRAVERAARLGQAVDYPTGQSEGIYETRSVPIEEAVRSRRITSGQARTLRERGQTEYTYQHRVGSRPETRRADFTGLGDADIEGELLRAGADIQLDLQRRYGEDFARAAAEQVRLSDPEGAQAREMLAAKILEQDEARKTRQRPVAEALDAQLRGELALGRNLAPADAALAEDVLRRRGGTSLSGGDVSRELQRGSAGLAREQGRINESMRYLGSGATPQDAAFREEQQSLANLANFLGGRTPTSQFSNLSAPGATPLAPAPSLPRISPDQSAANQIGVSDYTGRLRNAANQVSPWFIGLNAAINGAGAVSAARGRN